MDDVRQCRNDPEYQLWDTRERDEWTGHKLMRGAFRKGRIPWARFLKWKESRQPVADGGPPAEFKTEEEIQKIIRENGIDKNKHQIFYCQAGVRTTINIFTLYLIGWDPARLHNYDGSWIQWSYFDKNPIYVDK
jgi:thiosulfate/3-mercaptopyruvate sulfurtransferase